MAKNTWMKIPCSTQQLQLKATLMGGQSFRFVIISNETVPRSPRPYVQFQMARKLL